MAVTAPQVHKFVDQVLQQPIYTMVVVMRESLMVWVSDSAAFDNFAVGMKVPQVRMTRELCRGGVSLTLAGQSAQPASMTLLATHAEDSSAELAKLLGACRRASPASMCAYVPSALLLAVSTGRQCFVSCNLPIMSADALQEWLPLLHQHLRSAGIA